MVEASYTVQDGKLTLQPLGQQSVSISETDTKFMAEGLTVAAPDLLRNDVTIIGELEPELYVRNYFMGDGLSSVLRYRLRPMAQPQAPCSRRATWDRGLLPHCGHSTTQTIPYLYSQER